MYYAGNPTAGEVRDFRAGYHESRERFCARHGLGSRPIVALLAGSREQEIKNNLPMMVNVARRFGDWQFVVACVPSVDGKIYDDMLCGLPVSKVTGDTYSLLSHSVAALVTSGTATLETCCFGVPQVVLYKTPLPRVSRFVWDNFFRVKYISLVNLIAGKEVVPEMMAEKFSEKAICRELGKILPPSPQRREMLKGYDAVAAALGDAVAPDTAAHIMKELMV